MNAIYSWQKCIHSKRYDVFRFKIGITTVAFSIAVLVLMKLIFIRDGAFDISGNGVPLHSRAEINLFISLICTSDI